jgi:3-oxoacyl-(acyl-carrier-protein) synthase/acyl carrier protein
VNAFGIGGLNVHVVVDEYLPSRVAQVAGAGLPEPAQVRRKARGEADAIAVIGMGAVMPGALTRDALWELLASPRDARAELTPGRWDAEAFYRPDVRSRWTTPSTLGGYITGFSYDWRKHKIPPKQIQQASPLQFMILDAVDQAFQQANYHQRPFDRQQVGVVVGTMFGGEHAAQIVMGLRLPIVQQLLGDLLRAQGLDDDRIASLVQSYAEVLLKRMPALLDETGSFTASALASRVTKSFDLMGGAVAVDAGQASSMAALSCCVDQLRSGDCEMMICIGGQNDMGPMLYLDWKNKGRLAAGHAPVPLDIRANGVVPAEGCGAVLLKRLADARRDNDPILGIIRGIGAARDVTPAVAAETAVSRALADSGLTSADVSLVEISPTGQAEADAGELQGISNAYRGRSLPEPILLGTAVGQLGDLGSASGMASLLKAAWEVERAEVPAIAGLRQAAPHVVRHRSVLALPRDAVPVRVNHPAGKLIAGIHSGGVREDSYHVYLERGTKLKPTRPTLSFDAPSASPPPEDRENEMAHQIVHFDATTRRREKMRQHADTASAAQPARHQANGSSANGSGSNGSGAEARAAAPPASAKPAPISTPAPVAQAPAPQPARPAPAAAQATVATPAPAIKPAIVPAAAPQPRPAPAASASPAPVSAGAAAPAGANSTPAAGDKLDARELEAFLVNFVVEQTGYPVEIVELDADLEADLGIDSIKKAQLFGELGEYFEVQASADLPLDDFRTLRRVLDFLLQAQGAAAPATVAAAAVAPATVAPATVAPAPAAAPPEPAPMPSAAAPAASTNSAGTPAAGDKLDARELEAFLVNFVVEQTGYPVEIVELDADLEADLGIDSIKKAQLFGELGEYFEVQASADLPLDDFRTLRRVLDFLLQAQGATSLAAPAAVAATPAAPRDPAPLPSSAAPAASTNSTGTPAAGDKLDARELEAFLVNFVVEQTGYPVEIVELDADLEADLGIDSIKKAQLFGELGEYFEVQASADLPLDDFRTLRRVLDFLLSSQESGAVTHR